MIFLNCKDNPITYNKKNYLVRAQERMGINVFGPSDDYILNIEPCDFRYGKIWTGLWHIDNMIGDQKYYAYKLFDTVFTADLSNEPKAQLLLQALDPELHRRIPEIKQEYDFVISCSLEHVSDVYKRRNEVYALLKQNFKWVNLGKNHKPEEYVRGLNKAKVQVIQSMEVNGKGEIAQRFFECLGIGPVLTNWTPELEHTGLIEGKDYLAFRNDNELLARMKLLLSQVGYRRMIAENGRKKAILYHSYENRIGSILNAAKYA